MKSFFFALLFGLLICPALLFAQQDDQRASELGERQRRAESKMKELEAKFEMIAQKLEAQEPERAARLKEALNQAKGNLIKRNMAKITVLLNEKKYDEAEELLNSVILNLEELVRLLLNDKENKLDRQQEMEQLKKWKEQIIAIKKDQQKQTRETDKVANKDQTLADLQKQIEAVRNLIKKQEQVIAETESNQNRGLQALDRVADKQFELRRETEDLAEALKIPDADTSQAAESPKNTPGESEQAETKPGQKNNTKPNSPPSSAKNSNSTKSPGQQGLENASQNQKQAEEQLTEGRAAAAKRSGSKAVEDLESALRDLEKEKRRIASLPPEAFQKMAEQQRATREKAKEVAKDMEQSPQGQNSQDGSQAQGQQSQAGQSQSQQKQPGQQSLQRAQQSMQNASDDLSDQEAQQASRQQKKAEEELDAALREIEERLDQLREETREEKLARLEARFREMLFRQQVISLLTNDLDEKRRFLGNLKRRDILNLLRMSTEEVEISELGQQAYDLLLEDGTSVVFPEMVQQINADLNRVALFLQSEQTGPLTQLVQAEIESGIEEMLEALKKSRQQGQGGGGGGGGGGGNQPLLQKSAELKMLRAAQLRVNRLTRQFDLIRPDGKLEDGLARELDNIRVRQTEIVEMMMRMLDEQ